MLLFAQSAKGWRLCVVDLVLNGLERLQVREDRLEVFVIHPAIEDPRHLGMQLARADFALTHCLDKSAFIVIADP